MAYRIEIMSNKTGSKIETLEKLNAEAYKGIQKSYDRKCEIEKKHGEKLKDAAENTML